MAKAYRVRMTAVVPRRLAAAILLLAHAAPAAPPDPLLARTARAADEFQRNAARLVSTELLHQTSFARPPHGFLSIGAAALDVQPRFFRHDIVSEYTIGHLKGGGQTSMLEFRELVSMDRNSIRTPAAARRALSEDVKTGEEQIRKRILAEFTKLGLVDVATDYGTILLAFTTAAQADLTLTHAGDAFVGAEDAYRIDWVQNTGGALEFRGKRINRRPLHGSLWIRKSDGLPLRISASFEHEEPQHTLRDDATIDYAVSALDFPTPLTVTHRHFVDGQALTENLYRYEPFHLFTTDTTIHYETPK